MVDSGMSFDQAVAAWGLRVPPDAEVAFRREVVHRARREERRRRGDLPADLRYREPGRHVPVELDDRDQAVELASPADGVGLLLLGRAAFFGALDGPYAAMPATERLRLSLRVARVAVMTAIGLEQHEICARLGAAGDPCSERTVRTAAAVARSLEVPEAGDVFPEIPQ